MIRRDGALVTILQTTRTVTWPGWDYSELEQPGRHFVIWSFEKWRLLALTPLFSGALQRVSQLEVLVSICQIFNSAEFVYSLNYAVNRPSDGAVVREKEIYLQFWLEQVYQASSCETFKISISININVLIKIVVGVWVTNWVSDQV